MAYQFGDYVTPDNIDDAQKFYDYFINHPEEWQKGGLPADRYQWYMDLLRSMIEKVSAGDYSGYQSLLAFNNVSLSPEQEKSLDNAIAQQNTQQAQGFEEHMRDTNITSSGEQYASMGLSPSILSGGITSSNGVGAAQNVMSNLGQGARLEKYRQQMGMTRQMISMAGSMASSGIYGASLNAARHAASSLAQTTAHSGLAALHATQKAQNGDWQNEWNALLKDSKKASRAYDRQFDQMLF